MPQGDVRVAVAPFVLLRLLIFLRTRSVGAGDGFLLCRGEEKLFHCGWGSAAAEAVFSLCRKVFVAIGKKFFHAIAVSGGRGMWQFPSCFFQQGGVVEQHLVSGRTHSAA